MARRLATFLLALLVSSAAFADGGRLQLSRAAGPFEITVFTLPDPLVPGPADFSVMVQDRNSGQIYPDAVVDLSWIGPASNAELSARADHTKTTNKLMQGAEVSLTSPGTWKLKVDVRVGAQAASLQQPVQVQAGSTRTKIVFTFLLLPATAISLFVLHQRQKAFLLARRFIGAPGENLDK